MDILNILSIGAQAAQYIFTMIYYANLTWSIVKEWFQSNKDIATQRDNIAATVKTKLDSGDYAIIEGIFNKKTGQPVKGRIIKYDQLDSQLLEAHSDNEVVIWQ